jgi:cobalt-zinc-cadmium efflux system outer membrane protein
MNLSLLIFLLLSFPLSGFALSFSDVIKNLNDHRQVKRDNAISKSLYEKGNSAGSWGDSKLKFAAKNFPKDSLSDDESPMTGIEIGISQKISLTTKYGNLKDSLYSLSKSNEYEAQNNKNRLITNFWSLLIVRRKTNEEEVILVENLKWIKKILKVSKKLYANGRVSQQAILEIQIRKSELESRLSSLSYSLKQIEDNISYLAGNSKLDYKTIPWILLDKKSKENDLKDLALKEKLKSSEYKLTAAKMNYVPDLTFSVGYTKRSDIDSLGDFVSASVSFPLPTSSRKYAGHSEAIYMNAAARNTLADYQNTKTRDVSIQKHEIAKLLKELEILENKTLKFSKNSRTITSKSYGLGNSSYVELLQSELNFQNLLLKRAKLIALKDIKKITLKFILGEKLYE